MITKNDFSIIDQEVKDAIAEVFDYIELNSMQHDYLLFLADGEYKESYKQSHLRLNPYSLSNLEDFYKDESRINFMLSFLTTFYSFPKRMIQTKDTEETLTMEMMVYTHIWESKPFLKELFRLASLAKKLSYKWKVYVPEMGKHKFIRFQIRDGFKSVKLKIETIISKSFHTSLRNAFAHSEYSFNNFDNTIHLHTFKNKPWDIEKLTFNDWTKRFAYSALLSYYLGKEKTQRRKQLVTNYGTEEFIILHPIHENKSIIRTIYYDPTYDRFGFYPFS